MNVNPARLEIFRGRLVELIEKYKSDDEMCRIVVEDLMMDELEGLGYDVKPFRDF